MRSLRLITCLLVLAPALALAAPDYAKRRAELMRRLGPDAMLILVSPPPAQRNGDVDWPFRQEDSLLYLTGQNEPETSLVLVPGESEHREIVFTRDSNPSQEVWTGRIPTRDEVARATGVKEVVSSTRFRPFLQAAMEGRSWGDPRTYRSFGGPGLPAWRAKVRNGQAEVWMIMENRNFGGVPSAEQQLIEELRHAYPELQFRDAWPELQAMRMVKDADEIALVQRAIDVTVAAQKAAMHYETNNDPITKGGLMLTDIGAEVDGYAADVTRTYPQSGHFTPEQRAIYEAVLHAQTETIKLMKPGTYMRDVHEAAIPLLGERLLALGLVSKNERDQVRMYFIHGLGHDLGLRVHDVSDRSRKLEPGMIVTNEPGLYVGPTTSRRTRPTRRCRRRKRPASMRHWPSTPTSACASRTTSW